MNPYRGHYRISRAVHELRYQCNPHGGIRAALELSGKGRSKYREWHGRRSVPFYSWILQQRLHTETIVNKETFEQRMIARSHSVFGIPSSKLQCRECFAYRSNTAPIRYHQRKRAGIRVQAIQNQTTKPIDHERSFGLRRIPIT